MVDLRPLWVEARTALSLNGVGLASARLSQERNHGHRNGGPHNASRHPEDETAVGGGWRRGNVNVDINTNDASMSVQVMVCNVLYSASYDDAFAWPGPTVSHPQQLATRPANTRA